MKKLIIIFVLLFHMVDSKPLKCNRYEQLCSRRYNEVVFPGTHNSTSYKKSPAQNQDLPLLKQLEAGIRFMKMGVHYEPVEGKNVLYACHGGARAEVYKWVPELATFFGRSNEQAIAPYFPCILDPAAMPLEEVFADVYKFLMSNKNEIVTLLLEDVANNRTGIGQLVQKTKLDTIAWVQDVTKPWPTLQEMINQNKRVVIFVSGGRFDQKHPYLHSSQDYVWGYDLKGTSIAELRNSIDNISSLKKINSRVFDKRNAEPKNSLFQAGILVTPALAGNLNDAKIVNSKEFLQSAVDKMKKDSGVTPNFVEVDFFEYPNNDLFEVVNELNGIK